MEQLIDPFEYGGAVVRVGLADSKEERESCYRLRYRHFCIKAHANDVRRLDPKDYPDGLEFDKVDETSYLLIATKTVGEKVTTVGTFRFNLCTEEDSGTVGHPFGDGRFELPKSHRGEVVRKATTFDAGRWVAHPVDAPSGDRKILIHMLLVEAGLVLSQRLGIRHWAVIILVRSVGHLRADGWMIDPIFPGIHTYCNLPSEGCLIPMNDYGQLCPPLGAASARRKVTKS